MTAGARGRGVALIAAGVGALLLGFAEPGGAGRAARGMTAAGASRAGHLAAGSSPRALDASAYAAGACVAYPPTGADRHQTVFLDAAGSAREPGLVIGRPSGLHAQGVALAVVVDTARLLQGRGFTVVVSRSGSGQVARLAVGDVARGHLTARGIHRDLMARARCANQSRARLLVSVGFGGWRPSGARGSVTSYEPLRPFAEQNLQLAELLQGEVGTTPGIRGSRVPAGGIVPIPWPTTAAQNAAAATDQRLMLLGPRGAFNQMPSTMPGAQIEPWNLLNPSDAAAAGSQAGQQAVATGIAAAVTQLIPPPGSSAPRRLAARFRGERDRKSVV